MITALLIGLCLLITGVLLVIIGLVAAFWRPPRLYSRRCWKCGHLVAGAGSIYGALVPCPACGESAFVSGEPPRKIKWSKTQNPATWDD